ncbi:T cell receptor beta chain MC.7.G5-like [Polymixia lowei]
MDILSPYGIVNNNDPAYFGKGTKLTVLERNATIPTVKVFEPSNKECKDKKEKRNKKTIVCVATGFYPDHVSVSWQIQGSPAKRGVSTDNNALKDGDYYSITSRLRVSAKDWFTPGKTFTCFASFYNGEVTTDYSDTIEGVKGEEEGMTKEKYMKITRTAILSYGVFIAKSVLYAGFVMLMVWKRQGSSKKRCN